MGMAVSVIGGTKSGFRVALQIQAGDDVYTVQGRNSYDTWEQAEGQARGLLEHLEHVLGGGQEVAPGTN